MMLYADSSQSRCVTFSWSFIVELGLDGLHQRYDPSLLGLELARVDLAVGHGLQERTQPLRRIDRSTGCSVFSSSHWVRLPALLSFVLMMAASR